MFCFQLLTFFSQLWYMMSTFVFSIPEAFYTQRVGKTSWFWPVWVLSEISAHTRWWASAAVWNRKKPPKPKNLWTLKILLAVLSKMLSRQQVFLSLFFFNMCETAYHLELVEVDCWWLMLLSFQSLWILIFFPTIASATYCTTPSCNLEGYKRGCRENWGFIF